MKYRPSNATEGDWFMGKFCLNCQKYSRCKIPERTMFYVTEDPEYPKQWTYQDTKPVCTAFSDKSQPKPYNKALKRSKALRIQLSFL